MGFFKGSESLLHDSPAPHPKTKEHRRSFFVNPAIAAAVLLSVTSLSAVAHAALPPQQPTCSAATISGTYEGRGSGTSSFEEKGKVEPETHTVRQVFDGKGSYLTEATYFVRGRQTRQVKASPGSYTVDGACHVVFKRVWPEDNQLRIWTGTVTPNGNKISKRIEQAGHTGSTELVRVPPR
jgi:hypothetical protein